MFLRCLCVSGSEANWGSLFGVMTFEGICTVSARVFFQSAVMMESRLTPQNSRLIFFIPIFPADICQIGRAFVIFRYHNSYNEGMNMVLEIAGEIGSGSCVASGERAIIGFSDR